MKLQFNLMSTCIPPVLFSMVLALAFSASVQSAPMPDWTLKNDKGQVVQFYQVSEDRISVLLFWATWCPYCRKLMPHLQTLADEFTGKPVDFYALNVWEEGNPAKYIKDNNFTFSLLLDAAPVAEKYGVKGTPDLMVIDGKHEVQYLRVSGEEDETVEKEVRATIKELLK